MPHFLKRTAVVVIDVQTGLFCTEPPPFESEAVISRINEITANARKAGAPVFFTQHDGEPNGDWLVPFTEGWALHSKLAVEPGERVIRKTTGDAFYRTTLESELRSLGITTLVLLGFATEFCIDSTLRNAVSKDFEVIIVADAHTTTDSPILKAKLARQYFNWVWSESISKKGIRVVSASDLAFPEERPIPQASVRQGG